MAGGLNPEQRRAVDHEDGPAADRGRRRDRQDPDAGEPPGPPARRRVPPERMLLVTFSRRAADEMVRRAGPPDRPGGGPPGGGRDLPLRRPPPAAPVRRRPRAGRGLQRARPGRRRAICWAWSGPTGGGRLGARPRSPAPTPWSSVYSRVVRRQAAARDDGAARLVPLVRRATIEGIAPIFDAYTARKRAAASARLRRPPALLAGRGRPTRRSGRRWPAPIRPRPGGRVPGHQPGPGRHPPRPCAATTVAITVVGDDAQAIYSFRAATVRNILDFPGHFPGASTVTLEQNYRSTQPILDLANAVMADVGAGVRQAVVDRRAAAAPGPCWPPAPTRRPRPRRSAEIDPRAPRVGRGAAAAGRAVPHRPSQRPARGGAAPPAHPVRQVRRAAVPGSGPRPRPAGRAAGRSTTRGTSWPGSGVLQLARRGRAGHRSSRCLDRPRRARPRDRTAPTRWPASSATGRRGAAPRRPGLTLAALAAALGACRADALTAGGPGRPAPAAPSIR